MGKIKILIADDHTILREGIVSLLQSEESFSVAGTANNGFEVMELVSKHEFDVCLVDINMPGMDGIQTAKWLRENKPAIRIIMLTTYDDREIISELVHIGVSGYLLKNSDKQELIEAVNKVMKGRHYFSEQVERIILLGLTEKKVKEVVTLTEREIQIVQLLAKEYTNDKIAKELTISYRTVESHRKNIMQKVKAQNLAGLIRYAYNNGILT
jgi:DNA-binding NarL/FixJ family response regulator